MNLITETLNNLTWINLFILTMGAYSLTRLVVTDSITDKARDWVYHRFPHDGYASEIKPLRGKWRRTSNNIYVVEDGTLIGDLLMCPWCFGFWMSLLVCGSFVFWPSITIFVLLPFAMRVLVGGYANKIGGG